jgi:hypothetical protein
MQIVQDAAILGEQQRIFLAVDLHSRDIGRDQLLQLGVQPVAGQEQLPHMADIEQPRMLAHPQMLGHDAFILDRHFIARERHHPPAARAVPRVERQQRQLLDAFAFAFDFGFGNFAHRSVLQSHDGNGARCAA